MNRSIANWIKERNVCVDKEQRLRNLILVYGNYTNADIQNIDTETLLARMLKKINDQTIEYRSGGDISTTITKDFKNYVVTDELGNFTLVNNNPPPAKRPTLESLKLLLNNKPAYGNPETVRNYLNQVTRLLAELDSRTAPVQTELSIIATYYGSAASVSVNLDDVTRERDKLLLQIEKCTKDSDRLLLELNEVKFKNGDLQAKCASLQSALDDALSKPGSIVEETVVDTSSINMAPTYADASTNINLSTAANDSANTATQTDNITEDLTRNIAEQQLFEPNDTDRDLRDCLQEAASLREQLMELNQEIIVMRTEIMSLQQRLVDRNGENDQFQNTIRQQSTTIKQLQGDNLKLQADNNELHSYGTNTINELNQKLTECEQTLADHKNNQDKLIAEIENDAGNFIEEELAKNQSTSNTNEQLYAYIKYLQNTLTAANALNAQLRRQLQECIDSNNSDNLIEQIRLLTENKTTLLQETAVLNDKVLNSEKLLENVTQELEHTVVTKNNDIAGLRNQLNECRADLNACNDKHENPLEFNESLCSQEFSYLFNSHKMFQVVKEFVEEIMTSINVPEQIVNEWVSQEIITKHMMDSAKDVILEKILTISAPTSNVLEETVAAVVNELNPPVVETSYIPGNSSPVINTGRERSPMREENLRKNRIREKPIPVETIVGIEQPVVNTSIGQEATTIIRDRNSPDTTSIVNEDNSSPVIIRNITPVRESPVENKIGNESNNTSIVNKPDEVIEVDEPQSLFTKRKLETPEVSPQKRNKITTTTETAAEATDNITANDTTKINETTNDKTITKKPGRRVTLQPVRTSPYSVPSTSSKRYPTPSTSSAPYPESRSNRLPNYVTTYTITTRPGPPTSITLSGTADEVQHMTEMLSFYRALYLNYAKLAANTELYIQYLDNVKRWFNILTSYCKALPTFRKVPELTVYTFESNIPSGAVSPAQMNLMNDLTYDGLNTLGLLSSNLTAMEAYVDGLIEYDKRLRMQYCTSDLPQLPALPDNLIPVPKFKLTKENELARYYSSSNISGGRPREDLFATREAAMSYVDKLQMKYGSRKKHTQADIDWYEKVPSDATRPVDRKKEPTKSRPEQLGSYTIEGTDRQQLKQIKSILEDSDKPLADEQIKSLEQKQNEIEARLRKKKPRKKLTPAAPVDQNADQGEIVTVEVEFEDDAKLLQEFDVNALLQQLEDEELREDIDKDLEEYYDESDDDEGSIASSTQK